MRILTAAAPLAALVALPLLAAKPPAPAPIDAEEEAYRDRGVSACLAELRTLPNLSPAELHGLCGCAVDRFVEGRETDALPPIRPGRFRGQIGPDLISCSAELRVEQAAAAARARAEPPPAAAAAPVAPKPPPDGDATQDEPEGAAFDPLAWLRGLALPAWLAALPRWAWIALGLLVLLLAGGVLRRRDDRRDLLGPPPSMRQGTAPRPRPFRLEL
jgi:hypothetical protein